MLEMDAKAIGEKLVELRGKKTQEEVSTALGISGSTLSMYERGERIPRDNIKIRISAYYQEPIHKIFYPQITRNVSDKDMAEVLLE